MGRWSNKPLAQRLRISAKVRHYAAGEITAWTPILLCGVGNFSADRRDI